MVLETQSTKSHQLNDLVFKLSRLFDEHEWDLYSMYENPNTGVPYAVEAADKFIIHYLEIGYNGIKDFYKDNEQRHIRETRRYRETFRQPKRNNTRPFVGDRDYSFINSRLI